MKIHEAINKVMQEVGYVKKSRSAGLNYSYAGEAALIAAIRPAMVENGLYMSVFKVNEIRRENFTTSKGTAMVNTIIHATIRFYHTSGETIDVEGVGEGMDAGDKSANKAMTGLYKYALRQTFCIETGDDPDKFASEEIIAKPVDVRAVAVERYNARAVEAKKLGIEVHPINDKMTFEEIVEAGKELKSRMPKEGK